MSLKANLIFIALFAVLMGAAQGKKRGFATAKDAAVEWASNTCQLTKSDKKGFFLGAVSLDLWKNGKVCGKCIKVRSIQGRALTVSRIVKIVDFCDDCNTEDIDLSAETYAALGASSDLKQRVEWEMTDCVVEPRIYSATGRSFSGRKLLQAQQ